MLKITKRSPTKSILPCILEKLSKSRKCPSTSITHATPLKTTQEI